jgi:hypothetical protein
MRTFIWSTGSLALVRLIAYRVCWYSPDKVIQELSLDERVTFEIVAVPNEKNNTDYAVFCRLIVDGEVIHRVMLASCNREQLSNYTFVGVELSKRWYCLMHADDCHTIIVLFDLNDWYFLAG